MIFRLFQKHKEDNDPEPYLIVGLGNPGQEYRDNRHNVGFMALDRFCVTNSISISRLQSRALIGSGRVDDKRVIAVKPRTFMNLSGQAVASIVRFHKVPLEKILVIHDDLDLSLGTLRLRPGGGSGGQKGLVSIIENLGTQDFPRLRVGIGRPPGRMDAAAYVLQDFSGAEMELIEPVLEKAALAAVAFIRSGLDEAMNKFNGGLATE